MLKRIKNKLITLNISFMLVMNLFLSILFCLGIIAGLGFIGVQLGWLDADFYREPIAALIIAFMLSIMLGTSLSFLLYHVLLEPLKRMVTAMKQLARGDFTVRLQNSRFFSPVELSEFTDAFNITAQELGSVELLRKDFINHFSHEFKTPIVSIGGFARLLADEKLSEDERKEYISIIITESDRLASLSTSILMLSRIESQANPQNQKQFNLSEQVRQVVLLLETKWQAKAPRLAINIQECVYTGHEDMLKQVWLNILDNAIKFSPPGAVIELTLRCEAERIVFCVRDEGDGMDEQTVTHMFDEFYQGESSHAAEGNGLGLAIAQKIIKLHDGRIEAVSEKGQGTVITVTL